MNTENTTESTTDEKIESAVTYMRFKKNSFNPKIPTYFYKRGNWYGIADPEVAKGFKDSGAAIVIEKPAEVK